jgi:hypothetical protein
MSLSQLNIRHYESCLLCVLAVALLAAIGAAQLWPRIDNKKRGDGQDKEIPIQGCLSSVSKMETNHALLTRI